MRLERQSGDTSWKIPVPGLDRKPDKLPSTRLIRSGLQKAWPSQARLGRETVKRQRQPKCPSDKQINKRWHTHIMKEYSARGGMKFWQVPQHGQNLRTLNCVKYARY